MSIRETERRSRHFNDVLSRQYRVLSAAEGFQARYSTLEGKLAIIMGVTSIIMDVVSIRSSERGN